MLYHNQNNEIYIKAIIKDPQMTFFTYEQEVHRTVMNARHYSMFIYKLLLIYLAVVEYIFYTAIKAFVRRHILPVVMCGVKMFDMKSSKLQRRIHIQVLIERWHCVMCLTTRVIKLRRSAIL